MERGDWLMKDHGALPPPPTPPTPPTDDEPAKPALKRPVELKVHDNKVKRSDSLTKDEKTECNTKLRSGASSSSASATSSSSSSGRAQRRFVQRGESALKRRHTVGGTRDFDKVCSSQKNRQRRHAVSQSGGKLPPMG